MPINPPQVISGIIGAPAASNEIRVVRGEGLTVHAQVLQPDGNPVANIGGHIVYLVIGTTGSDAGVIERVHDSVVDEANATVAFTFTPGQISGLSEGRRYFYNVWVVGSDGARARVAHSTVSIENSIEPNWAADMPGTNGEAGVQRW